MRSPLVRWCCLFIAGHCAAMVDATRPTSDGGRSMDEQIYLEGLVSLELKLEGSEGTPMCSVETYPTRNPDGMSSSANHPVSADAFASWMLDEYRQPAASLASLSLLLRGDTPTFRTGGLEP
jgi:hypothetical protein